MRYFYIIFFFVLLVLVSVLGFRGQKSSKPPLYIFPDMDWQAKYQPQGENAFFKDGRNDRPVVEGTIVRGYGWDINEVFSPEFTYAPALNPSLYSGKDEKGNYITDFPLEVNKEVMALGQQKFNIFCIICHGASGDGNGITKKYGMVATASYHDDRLRNMAIGEIFETITQGKGQMGAYGYKLNPEERWSVIAYVRALQRSQNAKLEDVPAEHQGQLDQ